METENSRKKFKLLIVDDDHDHLSLVERYASSYGVQYKSAKNGAEAVECLKADDFSIVVTDMVMPEMDGMQLLKYTQKHHPGTDVIVMTGYSQHYSYIDVIKAGAADFILKPFKRDEFSAKLDRVFRERSLQKELRSAKEKAEAGSQAKTAFLCTIGHELITPMNGILGFTELLSDADLPPAEQQYVGMVAQSADRLMKLISQILDFSEIEAEKSDIKPSHFRLDSLFDDLFISTRPRAAEKGVQLNLVEGELESKMLLFGDKMGLTQILYNLVDNAIKFMDSGAIEIKVDGVGEPSDGKIELLFAIKDPGCGIEPDKQTTIFEPFTQAEEYMTRKHEGAGLGLAICAKLVSMMNGKIWVDSLLGKGSTFYFTVKMEFC